MRQFIRIVENALNEAAWETENWWEPKHDGDDRPPEEGGWGYWQRFGVPKEVENRYSNGQCMMLAYAMNERYGWPIKAEMYDKDRPELGIAHAYCVMPDGREIDVLGPQDKVDGFGNGPENVIDMTPEQVKHFFGKHGEDHLDDARKAVELFIAPKVGK